MLYRAHNAVQALAVAVRAVFCPTFHSLSLVVPGFWSAGASYPDRLDYRVWCASGSVYCPCSGSAWLELRILCCRALGGWLPCFRTGPLPCFRTGLAHSTDFHSRYPGRLDCRVSCASGHVYCPCSGSAWRELRILFCTTLRPGSNGRGGPEFQY